MGLTTRPARMNHEFLPYRNEFIVAPKPRRVTGSPNNHPPQHREILVNMMARGERGVDPPDLTFP